MDISAVEKTVMGKVNKRLLVLCMILYIINMLDRSCIGTAAPLGMNKALGIDPAQFGLLASLFFIGYFFCEVPSNIILHKTSARLWITRIMFTWGLVTSLMFFAHNFVHVAILRVLLGIAEAGFVPGIVYYMTFWYPQRYRSRANAVLFFATPIALIIGPNLAVFIINNVHWFSSDSWRWVFMLEGLMAIIACFFTLRFMTNEPKDAKWLTEEEKEWLINELAKENREKEKVHHRLSMKETFSNGKVWIISIMYGFIMATVNIYTFYTPTIVNQMSAEFNTTKIGYITALPAVFGIVALAFWGRHSDKKKERLLHIAFPLLFLSFTYILMILPFGGVRLKVIALALSGLGLYAHFGPVWSLSTVYLTGEAAAIGTAIINSMSSLGGFIGTNAAGILNSSSLKSTGVFIAQLVCALIAFAMAIIIKIKFTKEKIES